jgi:CMP-N-acetylneuraminic acid synthetase
MAIIPARGGSLRIPRKNVREFRGKMMLAYAIEAAQESHAFDAVVVSTDDASIAAAAVLLGARVHFRNARDDGSVGTQRVAYEVVTQAAVIYPCVPPLLPSDLSTAMAVSRGGASFLMSVGPDGADAGCFYVGDAEAFGWIPLRDSTTVKFELPAERVCDINTFEDWARAEAMFDALRRANV